MKKYYVMACSDVMEIGKPVSEWIYRENVTLPNETESGCWEITTEDYYFNGRGEREGKARVIHSRKDKVIEGEFDTVEEAFAELDKWY